MVLCSVALARGGLLPFFSTMAFPPQHDGRQRRQIQVERIRAPVRTDRHGFDAAQIAPPGSAVVARIAVDDFTPNASIRDADQKILAGNRRKVRDDQHRRGIA